MRFSWVTLAFACIEYFSKKKEIRPWSVKHLPEIPPKNNVRIRRSDTVSNLIFNVLFFTLFVIGTLRQPPVISWYELGEPVAPLFSGQVVESYLPLFVFLVVLFALVSVLKLIYGRWNPGIAAAHILYQISSAGISISFFTNENTFTDAFIARFADAVHISQTAMEHNFSIGITVLTVLIIIGTVADTITTIVKTAKSRS